MICIGYNNNIDVVAIIFTRKHLNIAWPLMIFFSLNSLPLYMHKKINNLKEIGTNVHHHFVGIHILPTYYNML